jgi:cytoskeletal protein RodZ
VGNLDTAQSEQLQAIGEYLQQIRLDQARSLEEIAAKTYIPLRILRALESGHEDILPEPVFVQGFIRRYGEALGLDGSELSQSFPVQRQMMIPEPRQDDGFDPSPNALQRDSFEFPRLSDHHRSPLLYGGVAVLLVGALVYGLSRFFAQPQRSTPSTVKPAPTAPTTSAAPVASPNPASAPVRTAAVSPKPAAGAAPITVATSLSDAAWLQVTVDGNLDYEGTLPKGTQRTWTAKQELTIVAGNAGAVSTSFNGSDAKIMGAPGIVRELTFTAPGNGTTDTDTNR